MLLDSNKLGMRVVACLCNWFKVCVSLIKAVSLSVYILRTETIVEYAKVLDKFS